MPQLALFAKQMHDLGLEAKLFVPDGGYTPDLPKQAGDAAAQAIYVTFQVPPTICHPSWSTSQSATRRGSIRSREHIRSMVTFCRKLPCRR